MLAQLINFSQDEDINHDIESVIVMVVCMFVLCCIATAYNWVRKKLRERK